MANKLAKITFEHQQVELFFAAVHGGKRQINAFVCTVYTPSLVWLKAIKIEIDRWKKVSFSLNPKYVFTASGLVHPSREIQAQANALLLSVNARPASTGFSTHITRRKIIPC